MDLDLPVSPVPDHSLQQLLWDEAEIHRTFIEKTFGISVLVMQETVEGATPMLQPCYPSPEEETREFDFEAHNYIEQVGIARRKGESTRFKLKWATLDIKVEKAEPDFTTPVGPERTSLIEKTARAFAQMRRDRIGEVISGYYRVVQALVA